MSAPIDRNKGPEGFAFVGTTIFFALAIFLSGAYVGDARSECECPDPEGDMTTVQEDMIQKENDVLWKLIRDEKQRISDNCKSTLETQGYQISHSEKRGQTR